MGRLSAPAALAAALLALMPATVGAQSPLGQFGATGKGPGQFDGIGGVATDRNGYVYVADRENNRVQKFTTAGVFVRDFGHVEVPYGDPPPTNALARPIEVEAAPDGTVFVLEDKGGRTRVSHWTAPGRFLNAFADEGSGQGQLDSPGQLAVDAAGSVYVADTDNHRVQKFSPDGRVLAVVGQGYSSIQTSDPSQLTSPSGVALAPDGSLYVADRNQRHVQRYNANGTYLSTFGDELFADSAGVAVFGDTVYVADPSNSTILRFTLDGVATGRVGGDPGAAAGSFSRPGDLAVDCKGTLYVSDVGNLRIQRLGAPGAAPCGNPNDDAAERLAVAFSASSRQSFAKRFGVEVKVRCDRPCVATLGGSVKVSGVKKAIRLRRAAKRLSNNGAQTFYVVPGDVDTDRIVSALRRSRKVVATVTVDFVDLRGQRRHVARTVRLAR